MTRRATIVGSGPNGLAAAITLAQRDYRTTVIEGSDQVGGGMRTETTATLPGFIHDTCSSVYSFAASSPFFCALGLERHGLQWAKPPIALAHPLDGSHGAGRAVIVHGTVGDTALGLGIDGDAYTRMFAPLVRNAPALLRTILGPVGLPQDPLVLARFGAQALRSARDLAGSRFRDEPARALLAGSAAHSMLPLDAPATASFALLLTICAHVNGWPFARGGAAALTDALSGALRAHGGEIQTGRWVRDLSELDGEGPILLDVAPWNLMEMARWPEQFARQMRRYQMGPGVVKVDYALDAPVPWTATDCMHAGTVHLGGTFDEIADAEKTVHSGGVASHPFVLVTQPSVADPTRAPEGKHVLGAYCHVPNGWTIDESHRIDAQIERFAPGFGARILARRVMLPADFEAHNPTMRGGDLGMGSQTLTQLLTRPIASLNPYATPRPGVYLCSAATPPGSGVHGMSGHRAALAALREPIRAQLRRRLGGTSVDSRALWSR